MVDTSDIAVIGAIAVILILTVGRVVESAAGVVGRSIPSGPVIPDISIEVPGGVGGSGSGGRVSGSGSGGGSLTVDAAKPETGPTSQPFSTADRGGTGLIFPETPTGGNIPLTETAQTVDSPLARAARKQRNVAGKVIRTPLGFQLEGD